MPHKSALENKSVVCVCVSVFARACVWGCMRVGVWMRVDV